MIESQNTSQAKFLIKELLAILKIMQKEEYDSELNHLMVDLKKELNDSLEFQKGEDMNLKAALEILSDGHTIISVKQAKEVCKFIKVPFNDTIVRRFKSDPPGTFKGLTMKPEHENTDGVYTLDLSRYVAEQLGVKNKARACLGRGFQAQAYAAEIKKVLEKK